MVQYMALIPLIKLRPQEVVNLQEETEDTMQLMDMVFLELLVEVAMGALVVQTLVALVVAAGMAVAVLHMLAEVQVALDI